MFEPPASPTQTTQTLDGKIFVLLIYKSVDQIFNVPKPGGREGP